MFHARSRAASVQAHAAKARRQGLCSSVNGITVTNGSLHYSSDLCKSDAAQSHSHTRLERIKYCSAVGRGVWGLRGYMCDLLMDHGVICTVSPPL